MDYLDPKKAFRHNVILLVGYVLIGFAILIATVVLVYQAYGFGVTRNGTVIQKGLVYFSSQPNPASIYIDGKLKAAKTNTRLTVPEGIYSVDLRRDGYRDWQRTITLQGSEVRRFDYPFLFPKKLATKSLQNYHVAPALATQSPDRRWLITSQPGSMTSFMVYDRKNPTEPSTAFSLPANLLTKATAAESWQLVEWADDNQHVLLQHTYDNSLEFIVLDRTKPAESLNLNLALGVSPAQVALRDKKYDQYYLYAATDHKLQAASLKVPALQAVQDNILAYHAYGDDTLLYVTDNEAPAGKVLVKLRDGDQTYQLRTLPAATAYVLDLAKYSGTFYAVAGAAADNKVYIYKDPIGQLSAAPKQSVTPAEVLHVTHPTYASFSNNAQFIMAESDTQFGVYDIENRETYQYASSAPLDPPQLHASWMDGNRLTYISAGKLTVFDYDNTNHQVLMPASSAYLPFFAPNYKFFDTLAPGTTAGQFNLTRTPLLTAADQ